MACRVQKERSHDNRDDVDLARTGIPALPACPGGVVEPRLERRTTARAGAVRGVAVRALHFRAAVATAGVTALLGLHLRAAGAAGAGCIAGAARAVAALGAGFLPLGVWAAPRGIGA